MIVCYSLSAQKFSEGIQIDYSFSEGSVPALQILFDKVSKNNVETATKEVFKKYDSKLIAVKDVDDEFHISDFTLKENQKLSKGKVKIIETNGNATMYAFFKTNESTISEELTPNDISYYKNLVKTIAKKAVFKEYEILLKEQEKEFKNEKKKLTNFEKDEANEHKNIRKYKLSITNSEQEIEQLKIAISNKEIAISKNNELLKAKEGEIAGKSVKSIDTRISDIKKDNKSLHKSIGKHKENIAEIKGEIAILNSSLKGNETEKVTLKSSENIDKKARKRLKALNKEGLKTIGEIEENKILVANEENNISNLETEIKTNNSNIELLQAELADHNEGALEEQLKLIEKEAKKLAQDQKGFQKSMKKANESINTNNEKIRVSEENIRSLKESQEKQKTNIKESLKKLNATKSTMKEYK
jgi:chromosome segregation ATPase